MLNHFQSQIPIFDAHVDYLFNIQCLDDGSEQFGVSSNYAKGFNEPSEGCGYANSFITAYYNRFSKWYRSKEIMRRARIAMAYSLAHMNEDGTIDLMETNFHDSTSNAFAVHGIGPTYMLMDKYTEHTPEEDEVGEMLRTFLKRSAKAMVNCGFHTPNHRWVVSAALSYCYNILGDEACYEHIQKFLAEGIDCDENGEYTERSAGTYNIICNRSLMILAKQLDMPELYEHVKRNLRMVLTYIEPDWTINTLNSKRQDFGSEPSYASYYPNYLEMALRTGDPEFAYIADKILGENLGRAATDPLSASPGCIQMFLLQPELEQEMLGIQPRKPVLEYDIFYEKSGIVRKRVSDATLTLIKDRPLMCKLQYRNKRMYVRFAGSFFGPLAQFAAQEIEKTERGYRLTYRRRWGYKRPLEIPQDTSDWTKMDHTKRADVCMQDFNVAIEFAMDAGRLEISVTTDGTSNIPTKLELMFDAGGVYSTDDTELISREGDYIFLKRGSAFYTFADHTRFAVNGGFYRHHYAKNMRGAIPGDPKAFSVVMTDLTPEDRAVTVRFGSEQEII